MPQMNATDVSCVVAYDRASFFLASSICTPTLIQGKLERTETNLMHFMREVT